MKRRWLWIRWGGVVYLGLGLLTLANGGCLWVAAGVASGAAVGYAYCKGKVSQCYNANFDDAWAAARTALTELGMPVLHEEHESNGCGFIESQTGDGDRVRINLETEPSKFPAEGPLTRICVRVALFGDHPVSYRLLDQISAHLVAAPLAGPPAPLPAPPPVVGQTKPIPPAGTPPQTPPPPLAN